MMPKSCLLTPVLLVACVAYSLAFPSTLPDNAKAQLRNEIINILRGKYTHGKANPSLPSLPNAKPGKDTTREDIRNEMKHLLDRLDSALVRRSRYGATSPERGRDGRSVRSVRKTATSIPNIPHGSTSAIPDTKSIIVEYVAEWRKSHGASPLLAGCPSTSDDASQTETRTQSAALEDILNDYEQWRQENGYGSENNRFG